MQDVILLVSTSAIFIFGYFLMNKLDVFLENNWNRQEMSCEHLHRSRLGIRLSQQNLLHNNCEENAGTEPPSN